MLQFISFVCKQNTNNTDIRIDDKSVVCIIIRLSYTHSTSLKKNFSRQWKCIILGKQRKPEQVLHKFVLKHKISYPKLLLVMRFILSWNKIRNWALILNIEVPCFIFVTSLTILVNYYLEKCINFQVENTKPWRKM